MSEFRRWEGKQLKPYRPTVGQILMTLFHWLTGALTAIALVLLFLMYG